jgi:hypothetical protein
MTTQTGRQLRPKRIPLGTRNVLVAPERKGYVRRFVNDVPGRIESFEAAGYAVVKEDIEVGDPKIGKSLDPGSPVSKSVGGGTRAVLMEIKEEWYEEDQQAKLNKITQAENDMKRSLNTPREGTYGKVDIS